MLGLSALPRGKMYQAATTEPKLVASMHAVFGIECQNVSHRRATTYALQASEGVVPIDPLLVASQPCGTAVVVAPVGWQCSNQLAMTGIIHAGGTKKI